MKSARQEALYATLKASGSKKKLQNREAFLEYANKKIAQNRRNSKKIQSEQ